MDLRKKLTMVSKTEEEKKGPEEEKPAPQGKIKFSVFDEDDDDGEKKE